MAALSLAVWLAGLRVINSVKQQIGRSEPRNPSCGNQKWCAAFRVSPHMCTAWSRDKHPEASKFDPVSPCQRVFDFPEDHFDSRFYCIGCEMRVGVSELFDEF